MARYIDAEETIRRIDLFIEGGSVFKSVLRSIKRLINNVPTADVVEVVHGEWIRQDETFTRFMCSECGTKNHNIRWRFCPNCGTKMDGKKVE